MTLAAHVEIIYDTTLYVSNSDLGTFYDIVNSAINKLIY